MSQKIKSKDLSYDSTLPPFLQRLRAQHTGQGDPDRHERPIARPRKAKDTNDDDGPTVVDESGEIVSRHEYDQLTNVPGDSDAHASLEGGIRTDAAPQSREIPSKSDSKRDQAVTDGTMHKKRKLAKIIGDESGSGNGDASAQNVSEKRVSKKPRKARPIKLAFDD